MTHKLPCPMLSDMWFSGQQYRYILVKILDANLVKKRRILWQKMN